MLSLAKSEVLDFLFYNMRKRIDLTGQKFNSLTVLSYSGKQWSNSLWLCRCDCGTGKIINSNNLKNGHTKSCGCLFIKKVTERSTTHGLAKHPLYSVWGGMKKRCFNNNCKAYKNYGGRGITVSEEWKNNFKVFYAWAMGSGYREGLQIDRTDNDGNYEPMNCRFSSPMENSNNRRNNIWLVFEGERLTASQLAYKIGIRPSLLIRRIHRGWSVERAIQ